MRSIIGARLLATAAAQPSNKPFEIRDRDLNWFLLRVQPSGVRSYVAQLSRGRRVTLGKVGELTADEARERCKKVLGNVAHGRQPLEGIAGADAQTLGDFIDNVYAPWLRGNRPKGAARSLERLKTHFGGWYARPLTAISTADIEHWELGRFSKGRKPATVLRDVMTLSGVFTRAVKHKRLTENPVRNVEKPKLDRTPKVRFLDPPEERLLREALQARDAEMQAARASANQWRSDRKQERLPAPRPLRRPPDTCCPGDNQHWPAPWRTVGAALGGYRFSQPVVDRCSGYRQGVANAPYTAERRGTRGSQGVA